MNESQDRRTIIFQDSVAADSNKTLVSRRIPFMFRTVKIITAFPLNTNRTLQLYVYLSADESAPTSEPPEGINILSTLGGNGYLAGDDEQKEVPISIKCTQTNMVLKIYAINSDGFEHTIDAMIIIQPLERS